MKKPKIPRKLTPPAIKALQSVRDHGNASQHLKTNSEHGGFALTMDYLRKHGLVSFAITHGEKDKLTTKGEKALETGRLPEVTK